MHWIIVITEKWSITVIPVVYCMEGNFGGGKHWQIWRMTMDLPNLFQPNFIQLKKVSCDKIYLRYYIGIGQCRTSTIHPRLYKTKDCLSLPVVWVILCHPRQLNWQILRLKRWRTKDHVVLGQALGHMALHHSLCDRKDFLLFVHKSALLHWLGYSTNLYAWYPRTMEFNKNVYVTAIFCYLHKFVVWCKHSLCFTE